jgi:hypothetical protein
MNTERALSALSRQLGNLTNINSLRESKAIGVLTILATLFLPLSLSASVLGMQTPFKLIAHSQTEDDLDLLHTNLLYDFFGIFIVLAAGTIFALLAIRVGLWLQRSSFNFVWELFGGPYSLVSYGKRWRYENPEGGLFEILRNTTVWYFSAATCIYLMVSFIEGMLQSGPKDYFTLEPAALFYMGGIPLALCLGTFLWLRYRTMSSR